MNHMNVVLILHTCVSHEKSENGRSSTPRKRSRWPTTKSAASTVGSHIILEITSSAVRMRGFFLRSEEQIFFGKRNLKGAVLLPSFYVHFIIKYTITPSLAVFTSSFSFLSLWIFFPLFWLLLCISGTILSWSSACVVWGTSGTLWRQKRLLHYLCTNIRSYNAYTQGLSTFTSRSHTKWVRYRKSSAVQTEISRPIMRLVITDYIQSEWQTCVWPTLVLLH